MVAGHGYDFFSLQYAQKVIVHSVFCGVAEFNSQFVPIGLLAKPGVCRPDGLWSVFERSLGHMRRSYDSFKSPFFHLMNESEGVFYIGRPIVDTR